MKERGGFRKGFDEIYEEVTEQDLPIVEFLERCKKAIYSRNGTVNFLQGKGYYANFKKFGMEVNRLDIVEVSNKIIADSEYDANEVYSIVWLEY